MPVIAPVAWVPKEPTRWLKLVRQAGPAAQLYGAKITGGGSGGTVAVLAQRGAEEHIQKIAEQYESQTRLKTTILLAPRPEQKRGASCTLSRHKQASKSAKA